MTYIKISQIQFEGKSTPYENAEILENYFKKTLIFKPDLITTPECSNIITASNIHLIKHSNYQSDCPVLKMAKSFAKLNQVNINIGSLLLKQKNKKKLINRSFLINKAGSIKKYSCSQPRVGYTLETFLSKNLQTEVAALSKDAIDLSNGVL